MTVYVIKIILVNVILIYHETDVRTSASRPSQGWPGGVFPCVVKCFHVDRVGNQVEMDRKQTLQKFQICNVVDQIGIQFLNITV